MLESLVQVPPSSSIHKIGTLLPGPNNIDFFAAQSDSTPMDRSPDTESDSQNFAGKRKKHEIMCPHKDRKHYAKVYLSDQSPFRICVAIVITTKAEQRRPGDVHMGTKHITQRGSVKLATCSSITRYLFLATLLLRTN